jgi:serine/threonine-protein kinase
MLPGAQALLYTSSATPTGFDNANVVVQPLSGGAPRTIVQGFYGRYVPTGHILYLQGATLFAVPFDLDRLEASGRPAPVVNGVTGSTGTGGAQFSVSATGTLVFFPGEGVAALRPMFWMNRAGETTPLRATPSEWTNPRFSPDGDKVAMAIADGGQRDVWTYDWRRDRLTKLTFDAADDIDPVWTPGGARIIFSSDRAVKGTPNLYSVRADGVGAVQRLTDAPNRQFPFSMHPSGKWLAFHETRPGTAADVMILPIEGDETNGWKPGTPREFVKTAATELAPMFSPDGRWIAYMSNETNVMQVYVRPFPDPNGGKSQISTSGGAIYPTWSSTRPELLFIDAPSGKIMAASYTVKGTEFYADKPHEWSAGAVDILGTTRMYDLHPDGERIAMLKRTDTDARRRDKVVFVFNFLDTLRRAAPRH